MILLYKQCLRGHDYTPENTQWSIGNSGKPQRSCKACHLWRARMRYRERLDKINPAFVDKSIISD